MLDFCGQYSSEFSSYSFLKKIQEEHQDVKRLFFDVFRVQRYANH